ncbi:Cache 3/Cache 2 fusion domain-containing protein [Rhodobacteraceae bacterium N5(2021)]|uniref:histidine kinase n=1 Tax=Gymnodinialimonas phycosphaerae TaxID=2841589 RepID=A0A975TSM5_9RHOB|nr:ATP-binding protein [Gymnodinialimonas phycosphaerae]MBY4893882.1 Cache 3/Cache 2 fusion domain-containing protein [Gymnodinialimonas phycosphaerae]
MVSMSDPELKNTAAPDGMRLSPNTIPGKIWIFLWSLRTRVFIMLLAAILAFGAGLQYWNYRMLFQNEVRLADDKHLVTATHLALSLSRYSRDVSLVFAHWARNVSEAESAGVAIAEDSGLPVAMDIDGFAILSSDNTVEASFSTTSEPLALPPDEVIEDLRIGSNTQLHGVQFSNLQRIGDDRYFILGYNLAGGQIAIGYLNVNYITDVQQRVQFGELGHAAIFDAAGVTVAHPVPAVEENMMNAAGIPVVARMLARETGVGQFYSPPMNADMIAGYTYVPETGWAVMVPQPIDELSASVEASLRSTNIFIIAVSLALALFGWVMTRALVRPIDRFTTAGLEIAAGNFLVDLPERENSSLEMSRLNQALKTMVGRIRGSSERLQAALEIEEVENKRKSDFLIIASHELRNPLSGVVGMLSACRERTDEPELTSYLEVAARSATQLRSVVDEMTHYAEEQTDTLAINVDSFDLGQELAQLATIYGQQAETAGLAFDFTPRPEIDEVIVTDRYRLFQVVANLLDNAIKYTASGGVTLDVGLHPDPDPDAIGDWLYVRVTDTGIGLDPDAMKQIFEPFFQVEGSYSRAHNGLGLGLAISKSIVDRLSGYLHCESEPGKGATFSLHVPIQIITRH